MSQLYAQAAQSGMSSLESMFTGSNAESRQAYDLAYGNEARRILQRSRIQAATKNLAALRQDEILTNKQIQVSNAHTQARIKLSAAVSGVTGNSVDDVSMMADVNTVNARNNNARQTEQLSEQFLSQINSATTSMLGIQDKKYSNGSALFTAFSKLDEEDYKGYASELKLFGG